MFLLGSQAYLVMQNIFVAPFWFLLPVSMVICNDIMAYLFGKAHFIPLPILSILSSLFLTQPPPGFFFGRTSLIKLSPNKTWEGFLGALGSTLIFGFIVSLKKQFFHIYYLLMYTHFFSSLISLQALTSSSV